MTRREFIYAAAAGAMGIQPARAELERRIKCGFLGVAHSHALEKFRVIRQVPAFEIIGLAETSVTVREPFEKLGVRVLSREELLAGCEVVVVESAVRDHARDAKAALAAGRHVHVEKPPTVTMQEMEELCRLAREKKRLLQVGYMWRYNPGFNEAIEAARNGWLGELFLVRGTMNTQIDARRRPEWAEFKGGAMFEQGCHLVDAVVRLLGKPSRIASHLQHRERDALADNCVAVFEFPKAQAIITNAVFHPNAGPHRFLEILGTNGTARVQPIEPPGLQMDLAKPAGPYGSGAQTIELPSYQRYHGEFVDLARAVKEGTSLPVSLEEEQQIQETVLRASEML